MHDWPDIIKQVQQESGNRHDSYPINIIPGGCINSCFLIGASPSQVFIKTNTRESLAMFEAEASGLQIIAKAGAISVPEVLCTGVSNNVAFIAMQALQINSNASKTSYQEFGRQLANMHRYQQSFFGSETDNTIGSTPQPNPYTQSWFNFWRKYRLGFQLELARTNGAPHELIDDGLYLNECFQAFFSKPPKAACLHGDLWQGNWGFTESGKPFVFDPAHYFGDRETDIAMTTLFGRAHPDFYAAYQETYPLRDGYTIREQFYNVYHILNHYNLFGGSYAHQAHSMVKYLLSELR